MLTAEMTIHWLGWPVEPLQKTRLWVLPGDVDGGDFSADHETMNMTAPAAACLFPTPCCISVTSLACRGSMNSNPKP